MLRVKILCTIGPASDSPEMLTRLIQNGMNIARLNFSHGTHEYHAENIQRIRRISAEMKKPIAILADLQGPKLRMGKMQAGGVTLEEGQTIVLTNEDIVGVSGRVPIQYKKLPQLVQAGERILIDDGLLELEVLDHTDRDITTRVVYGGTLHDNKGINLPDASLTIPALTEKDRKDVRFILEQQVDWIALSFVRTAAEVHELKSIIESLSPPSRTTPVISKIEKPDAVRNIDDIIAASDAIMVARGDLGIETSAEAVPLIQKQIITKCHKTAKPVITATQMLDSMIRNPRPTRAEASDVANAVLDGSDAIMLSGETAAGSFPIKAVETMVRIASEAERARRESLVHIPYQEPEVFTAAGAICHATIQTASETDAKAIVAPTMSGATAKLIAAFRPSVPVIAVTPNPVVQRRLCLHWGIYPLLSQELNNTDEVVEDALRVALHDELVRVGDRVIVTAGVVGGSRNATNLMMVRLIEDGHADGATQAQTTGYSTSAQDQGIEGARFPVSETTTSP